MAWNLLGIILVVCLAASAVGFKKYVYFLSLGYGFSIAAGAVTIAALRFSQLNAVTVIQLLLFVAYGLRLSGFLLVREVKSAGYRKTLGEATKTEKPIPMFVMVSIWICVAILYTAQVSPVLYRLTNGSQDLLCPVIGILIQVCGLYLESLADKQKSEQKAKNPNMVATEGLYRMVRCPNYFGEIVFWTGVFAGSLTALQGAGQWIMAVVAWVCIVYIMFNGAQRLEKRQMGRYGKDPAYKAYADSTPIIIPFLPVYHLNKEK